MTFIAATLALTFTLTDAHAGDAVCVADLDEAKLEVVTTGLDEALDTLDPRRDAEALETWTAVLGGLESGASWVFGDGEGQACAVFVIEPSSGSTLDLLYVEGEYPLVINLSLGWEY